MTDLSNYVEAGRVLAQTCGNLRLARALAELRARCEAGELFVTLVGETSVGKTTLVNTLLGEPLLPATPGATTGVPVEVRIRKGPRRFECVRASGAVEEIDRATLRKLVREPGSVHRLRVFWPASEAGRGLAEAADLDGLVLVDAPGYNSLEAQHQEILLDVIPESDAVVFLTNYRNGVTAADAKMLELVGQFVDCSEAFLFGVNRLPPGGYDRKRAGMERELAKLAGVRVDLMPLERLPSTSGSTDEVRIWNARLWQKLLKLANAPERRAQVEQNARGILVSAMAQLEADLDAQLALLDQRRREGVEPLERELGAVRDAQREAAIILDRAAEGIERVIVDTADAGRDRLYDRASRHIDDASRLTEADSCAAWVRTHLVPVEVLRTQGQLEKQLRDHARGLDRELNDLAAKLDGVPPVKPGVADVPYEGVRDQGARIGFARATAYGFGGVLERLGGAAGREAGFVNLAKTTVSKGGRLVGKRFGRPVYDNMGRALRKVGLNAGRATGIVVYVLVEAATWLYNVARWKQKLRGVLQHTLDLDAVDEPIEDAILRQLPFRKKRGEKPFVFLRDETVTAALEALEQTRSSVDQSLARQEQVLAEALGTEMHGVEAALTDVETRRNQARELIQTISTESTHVQA